MNVLVLHLVHWGLTRKPLRTVFLLLTVLGSLAAFAITDAMMRDLANKSDRVVRTLPYDLVVSGRRLLSAQEQIAALPGVQQVELAEMFEAIVGITSRTVAVLGPNQTLLPTGYLAGQAPQSGEEIVIDEDAARAQGWQLGDQVSVSIRGDAGHAVPYLVSGVVESQAGGDSLCLVTNEGCKRLASLPANRENLLIRLHDPGQSQALSRRVRSLVLGLSVKDMNSTLFFDHGRTISDRLISITMVLLATVATVTLYMLFSLGQQERAYELGVLRAIGFSRKKVIVVLVLEGVIILGTGGLLAFLTLVILTAVLDIGSWQPILAKCYPGSIGLLFLGLLASFWTARRTSVRPITTLFKN